MANNEQETPSLYMAICMVESLFMDIEANTQQDLSACPVGDVKLPVKLIWLCKTIQKIYENQSDDLQRSRARLDQAIVGLRETRAELEKLADVSVQCSDAEEEHARVSEELRQARDRRKHLELLEREVSFAKEELASLRQVDPREAVDELAVLHSQIKRLRSAQMEQEEKLDATRKTLDELKDKLHSETVVLEMDQKEQQELVEQLRQTETAIAACTSERATLDDTLKSKRDEYEALILEQSALERKIGQQQETITSYRTSVIDPLQKQLETLLETDKGGRMEKERLQAALDAAKQDKSNRVLQLGRLQTELDQVLTQISGKEEVISATEAQKAQAEKEYEEQNRKLDALQTAVGALRKNKETVLTMLQGEAARKTMLEQEQREKDAELERLKSEVRQMEDTLPEKEQQLREANEKYEQLTAAYTLNSAELDSRRVQIRELEAQTDKEKLATYIHQLERQKAELEGIEAETRERKLQIERGEKELQAAVARKETLNAEKRKQDADLRAVEQALQELAPVAAPEFRKSAEETADRLAQLLGIHNRLTAALSQISEYLGTPDSSPASGLEASIAQKLQGMKNGAEELQKALIQCANSLHLEER